MDKNRPYSVSVGALGATHRLYNMYRRRYNSRYNRGTSGGNRQSSRLRQARSRTQTQTGNRSGTVRSGQGVTTQYDRRLVYFKKNMPRFKKRRWKRFMNKVHAVSEKDLGTRQVVFNRSFSKDQTNENQQISQTMTLYGQQSSEVHNNDLYTIRQFENTAAGTPALGDTVWGSTKFIFKSGVLDVTIRNASTLRTVIGEVTSDSPDSRAKLEIDIYEIIIRKQANWAENDLTVSGANNLEDLYEQGINQEGQITDEGGAEDKVNYFDRGFTPFDGSYAISRFGIKILKKTKFFIPNGDTITYQVRDPKRRVTERKNLAQVKGFSRPGWTRVIYLVGKLVPGLPVGTTNATFQPIVNIGSTRKYVYKVEGITDDRTLYRAQ